MLPSDHRQILRVHDYTVLATLGISSLYGKILEQSEGSIYLDNASSANRNGEHTNNTHSTTSKRTRSKNSYLNDAASSRAYDLRSTHSSTQLARKNSNPPGAQGTPNGPTGSLSDTRRSGVHSKRKRSSSNAYASAQLPSDSSSCKDSQLHPRLKSAFIRIPIEHNQSDTAQDTKRDESSMRKSYKGREAKQQMSLAGGPALYSAERPAEYGQVWFDRYQIMAKLGEGAFSQAFLALDLFCTRMGKRHDGTRIVTIKRMGSKNGAIGLADYQTIHALNKLDPKGRVPIVRIYDIFAHSNTGSIPYTKRTIATNKGRDASSALAGANQRISSNLTSLRSSSSKTYVCLVMEPLLGGTLHDAFPKRVKELYAVHDQIVAREMHIDLIRIAVRQILMALAHMHEHALLHADIKTTNVICVDEKSMKVKLIDFGNALSETDVSEYYSTFEIQTVWFRAPEVAYQRPFGRQIDMWSIGCIMCELWLGHSLFTDMDNHGLIRSILKLRGPPPAAIYSQSPEYGEILRDWGKQNGVGFSPAVIRNGRRTSIRPEVSMDWDPQLRFQWLKHSLKVHDDEFIALIDSLLDYDPDERPTAASALDHPFFKDTYAV